MIEIKLTCICDKPNLVQEQECLSLDNNTNTEAYRCETCDRVIHITYYKRTEEDENNL